MVKTLHQGVENFTSSWVSTTTNRHYNYGSYEEEHQYHESPYHTKQAIALLLSTLYRSNDAPPSPHLRLASAYSSSLHTRILIQNKYTAYKQFPYTYALHACCLLSTASHEIPVHLRLTCMLPA
ncbi:hypothetical protein M501DRAFT_1001426 [Patellaria atrata CBS 101060]|uniref:Uncharacterized protein n=1 Tax=Patellaria atrata CBS 101060 TaxID=1346257 RepID=A0A9P4S140_9PEZI|nr:hypothetical protein M501DRAFT_1001426 [Patellaria atrata CBS 101060]